mgnify:FL=1
MNKELEIILEDVLAKAMKRDELYYKKGEINSKT